MQEVTPIEDDDDRDVFAHFGLAMYMAQVLEHELVNTLGTLQLLPRRENFEDLAAWSAQVDAFFDGRHADTFRTLLRLLKQTKKVPANLLEELRICRADRDFLAHNFFRVHVEDFASPSGRQVMLARTDAARERFSQLNQAMEQFSYPLMAQFGITEADLEREIEQDRVRRRQ